MTEQRLTRQELGWLLAQEAKGAAKSLRAEVTQLRASMAPPNAESEDRISVTTLPGEQSLRALDQAISMLNQLESGPKKTGRRSRIDLAALLYELAPHCRIALQPGAGTEVFGDEASFRRLLHMLLNQGPSGHSASPGEISIRREGDWIKIGVDLGPDSPATHDLERRWLKRMCQQQGGRFELHGRTQTIVLPAEQSSQAQVDELKRELDQAQQLGEIYARELASVVACESRSSIPSAEVHAPDSLSHLRTFANALLPQLVQVAASLDDPASGATEALSHLREVTLTLSRISKLREDTVATQVNLASAVAGAASALQRRASRRGVQVSLQLEADAVIEQDPELIEGLCYALLAHAISASSRSSEVRVHLRAHEDAVYLEAEDTGPGVPPGSVAELLEYRVDPAALGRPRGLPLLMLNSICKQINIQVAKSTSAELSILQARNGHTLTRVRLARPIDPS